MKKLQGKSFGRTAHFFLFAMIVLGCGEAFAAIKNCEELKTEIAAKITAKGVKAYELKIVKNAEADKEKAGKLVGSCENGSKKIFYKKGK